MFEQLGICKCGLNLLESRHLDLEFEHKFRIFFGTNQESYCRLNMAHLATRNSDSTNVPIEGRKT